VCVCVCVYVCVCVREREREREREGRWECGDGKSSTLYLKQKMQTLCLVETD
jgi:hypothetical protein